MYLFILAHNKYDQPELDIELYPSADRRRVPVAGDTQIAASLLTAYLYWSQYLKQLRLRFAP